MWYNIITVKELIKMKVYTYEIFYKGERIKTEDPICYYNDALWAVTIRISQIGNEDVDVFGNVRFKKGYMEKYGFKIVKRVAHI